MNDRYNIFDYYLTDSHIHKLNSSIKILSILLIVFCIVIADSFMDLVVINFYILVVMLWSNVSIRFYIRNFSIFRVIIIFIICLFSLIYFNIFVGIIWAIKFLDIVIYISIITMTTSFSNIVYGIEGLLCPFRKIIDVSSVSLKLGMGIKFVSLLYRENNRVSRSKKLRGVRFSDMKFYDKIGFWIKEIRTICRISLDNIEKIRDVMYVRNYGISMSRCNYRLNKWGKTDTILLVINVVVMVITFIY